MTARSTANKLTKTIVGVAAVGLATLGFVGAANAQQAGISNPRGMVENFDPEHLGPVLTDLGVAWREERAEDGSRYIQASIGANFTFNIMPTACLNPDRSTGCLGANYLALFKGVGINYQTVAAFNQQFAFSTAGVLPGGRDAYINRYEIADFGIARGNLASSIGSFVYLAERFRNEISASRRTVSAEGYAGDMAATRLNQNAAAGIGHQPLPESVEAMHQAEFERTAEFIRMLVDNEAGATNKISNSVGR
ncbi:MAG: hypothetical protein AAF224_07555 [Pseudomonadota bacterium]